MGYNLKAKSKIKWRKQHWAVKLPFLNAYAIIIKGAKEASYFVLSTDSRLMTGTVVW